MKNKNCDFGDDPECVKKCVKEYPGTSGRLLNVIEEHRRLRQCTGETFQGLINLPILPRFDIKIIKPFAHRETSCNYSSTLESFLTESELSKERVEARYGGFCFGRNVWIRDHIWEYFEVDGNRYPGVNTPDNVRNLTKDEIYRGRRLRTENRVLKQKKKGFEEDEEEFLVCAEQAKNNPTELNFMSKCLNNVADFGLDAVQLDAITQSETNDCVDTSMCADFQQKNENTCLSGIRLQKKKLRGTESKWEFVSFFPSNKNYCNGEIIIDFEMLGFSLTEYEVRFVEAVSTDNPLCDRCTPKQVLTDLKIEASFDVVVTEKALPNECFYPNTCRFKA